MGLTRVTRGETFAGHTDLKVEVCGECGVLFALPAALVRWARDEGDNFFCPNGHCLTFKETRAEELEQRLAREKARSGRLAAERDQLTAESGCG